MPVVDAWAVIYVAAEHKVGRRISRGGMLAALTVIFVYLGSISPTAKIAIFSLTSMCIAIAVTEMNMRFGLMVYLAAASISLAWPGLFAAWPFVFFFGPYPIWQNLVNVHLHGLFAWLSKSLFGHLFFWLSAPVFARPQLQQLSEKFGLAFWLGLPIIIQFIFMIYQYGLNLLIIYFKGRFAGRFI